MSDKTPDTPDEAVDKAKNIDAPQADDHAEKTINEKVTDPDLVLNADRLLHGRFAVLRRGRKTVGGAYLAGVQLELPTGLPDEHIDAGNDRAVSAASLFDQQGVFGGDAVDAVIVGRVAGGQADLVVAVG